MSPGDAVEMRQRAEGVVNKAEAEVSRSEGLSLHFLALFSGVIPSPPALDYQAQADVFKLPLPTLTPNLLTYGQGSTRHTYV